MKNAALSVEQAREITRAGGDVPHAFERGHRGPRGVWYCRICQGREPYAAHDPRLRGEGDPSESRETRVPAPLSRPETNPHDPCVGNAEGRRDAARDDSRDPREGSPETYGRQPVPVRRGNA